MNPKDNQSVFDFAIAALVAQGRPSISFTGQCMYRGPGGTKCAAGHCIPDSKYSPALEGAIVNEHHDFFAGLGLDLKFLTQLQSVHDLAMFRGGTVDYELWLHDMLSGARELAVLWQLSTEVVDLAEAALAEEGDTNPMPNTLDAAFGGG